MGRALKQVYWHFSTFKITFNSRKHSGAKLASTYCPALAQRPQRQALMLVVQESPCTTNTRLGKMWKRVLGRSSDTG